MKGRKGVIEEERQAVSSAFQTPPSLGSRRKGERGMKQVDGREGRQGECGIPPLPMNGRSPQATFPASARTSG